MCLGRVGCPDGAALHMIGKFLDDSCDLSDDCSFTRSRAIITTESPRRLCDTVRTQSRRQEFCPGSRPRRQLLDSVRMKRQIALVEGPPCIPFRVTGARHISQNCGARATKKSRPLNWAEGRDQLGVACWCRPHACEEGYPNNVARHRQFQPTLAGWVRTTIFFRLRIEIRLSKERA